MAREQYKTPDEDVAAEFERVCHLFSMALGRPSDRLLFDSLMSEASEQGMNWVQGLEYVVEQRQERGTRREEARRGEARRVRRAVLSERMGEGDLRRAG